MKVSLPGLVYLERYCNEGTRNYSRHAAYTEAWSTYRPESVNSGFDLPCFILPVAELNTYFANPSEPLLDLYRTGDGFRFCVHPQVLKTHQDEDYVRRLLTCGCPQAPLQVSPSSSTRTLFVRRQTPHHALKVHFPFRISRYGRKMRDEVIEQAINVSRELEANIATFDDRFAFLREVIGVSFKNQTPQWPRGEHWGYLVRDMCPFPTSDMDVALVPGFALYGKDIGNRQVAPLLPRLIGQRDPLDYVLEQIMLPILRHWVSAFLHLGYMLEPHGQNVLLEINVNHDIKRIVHRDLSVGIDMRRRRYMALSELPINDYNRMETGHFASITYDKFMGAHFFEEIASLCQHTYGISPESFRRPCRDEFLRLFPDHQDYFPPSVQYFSEKYDQFGKPGFVDTKHPPVWRPGF